MASLYNPAFHSSALDVCIPDIVVSSVLSATKKLHDEAYDYIIIQRESLFAIHL
jgi:hypothetical protein